MWMGVAAVAFGAIGGHAMAQSAGSSDQLLGVLAALLYELMLRCCVQSPTLSVEFPTGAVL